MMGRRIKIKMNEKQTDIGVRKTFKNFCLIWMITKEEEEVKKIKNEKKKKKMKKKRKKKPPS